MKQSDILRVARLCCAKIAGGEGKGGGGESIPIVLHDASDLNVQVVCSLWSGMGHIYKISLPPHIGIASNVKSQAFPRSGGGGNDAPITFIIKHVASPRAQSLSDRRKADSYQVEANFYERLASKLQIEHKLGVPTPFYVERDGGKSKNEIAIGMSFVENETAALSNKDSTRAVLQWLAGLHAAYWGADKVDAIVESVGLQKQGSYWYLDTRPDEHQAMPIKGWEGRLKRAAKAIDDRLKRDPLQCLIHGDAKEANVLYTRDKMDEGAIVAIFCDYQYCGKGPPTKDLAYFLCRFINSDEEVEAVAFYLNELTQRLLPHGLIPPTTTQLEDSLALAYCDFYRFMSGWGFSAAGGEEKVKAVLDRLDGGKDLGSEEAYDEAVWREYG